MPDIAHHRIHDRGGGEVQQRAWRRLKHGSAFASIMGSIAVLAQTNAEQLEELAALVDEKRVRAFVTKTLPLEGAREAHELLEAHGVVGKVVLTVP